MVKDNENKLSLYFNQSNQRNNCCLIVHGFAFIIQKGESCKKMNILFGKLCERKTILSI